MTAPQNAADQNAAELPVTELTPAQRTEVELLARGKGERARAIRDAKLSETPEAAHEFLLRRGLWDGFRVPYADRAGIDLSSIALPIPALPTENRLDLTHLAAFAIDDEGSLDPDDAISLEATPDGYRLWVHVADVAALITPNSPLDLEARSRGATLYLPDQIYSMVPDAIVQELGLGLHDTSPALSISIDFDSEWNANTVEVQLTQIRATRLSYSAAQVKLDAAEEPFVTLQALARASRKQREAEGALSIDLPEVRVKLLARENDVPEIQIKSLPRPETRFIVQECMTLAGWAAAIYADDLEIALPYATQDAPTREVRGDDLPAHWARRKTLARTRFRPAPGPHHGMGLDAYAQATSPMRRYLDLVVHQQLRAALNDQPGLTGGEIATRVAQAEMNAGGTRTAERLTRRHYTLVMLLQQPGSVWEAQVVERRGPQATVVILDLALDTLMSTAANVGEMLKVEVAEIDLPNLSVRLREVRG
jgi:exoribonuclease II